jgi:hypothetical protein
MLSKRRCPYTGVINFYSSDDPFLPVGSVVKSEGARYLWRYYADPCAGVGATRDMSSAEACLTELCAEAARREIGSALSQAA